MSQFISFIHILRSMADYVPKYKQFHNKTIFIIHMVNKLTSLHNYGHWSIVDNEFTIIFFSAQISFAILLILNGICMFKSSQSDTNLIGTTKLPPKLSLPALASNCLTENWRSDKCDAFRTILVLCIIPYYSGTRSEKQGKDGGNGKETCLNCSKFKCA